jgi:hypothetical protein
MKHCRRCTPLKDLWRLLGDVQARNARLEAENDAKDAALRGLRESVVRWGSTLTTLGEDLVRLAGARPEEKRPRRPSGEAPHRHPAAPGESLPD